MIEKMNELEKMFELQKQFQELIGNEIPYDKVWLNNPINIELIKNQILALYDEVGEALREVPWKPWKRNQQFNVSKFRMELIDIFHFLINLCLLSGMNAEDVFTLFQSKNQINKMRQKNGY